MSDHVHTTRRDGVLLVRIDRPSRRNALDHAMYTALSAALDEASGDDAIRAVLVVGSEGTFTAGNDLQDFLEHPPTDMDSPVLAFLVRLASFPKPLVAGVDGPAIGLGTTMLLHCDGVIASARATFRMPFVPLGLVPEAASSLLLPARVGHVRAMAWLGLGDAFGADDALAHGLVNAVVPPEEVEPAAEALAARFAAMPKDALTATKALIKGHGRAEDVRAAIEREADVFVERLASDEARQAIQAVLHRGR